ncbi:rhodanese-like domain-containing protein [Zwartia vadi]|uniref:rhodanese-like domain-containing protein n=1 Tax=Zwartia vadi TaxID=3058168 RepID=UPI0025B51D5B|nr:rhodanese-like domain-containing protein [Zwartia vadi]MDN3987336.1 rhodanese-like domain-containing protein [Zwartia vadi]
MDFFLSQNNLLLIGVALISGLALAWPMIQSKRAGASISCTEAVQMMNHQHAILIDIRPGEVFAAGHIPQARSIPANDIEKKAANLPKNKPLIVVCDFGRTAGAAAVRLRALGFTQVSVLGGGMRAWSTAGLPLSTK